MADVPLLVVSESSSAERRITPAWSISTLKAKLETVTGIPPSAQRILLKTAAEGSIPIEASNEESTHLTAFRLTAYAELHVLDTRPPGARPNYTDASGVEKYVMPEEEYAKKADSVLAWKKSEKLGRFDPNAPSREEAKIAALAQEVRDRSIETGKRCRVGGDDTRRGTVMYVGDVKEIPSGSGAWVGIQLDEPVGKNDGSINGARYWGEPSDMKHGVFVRPERVEIGDFPVMDDLGVGDMEEI
ncbi:CAP-Gly domain-containing protein [Diaporthe helianthi]|uniref:CAP-Gly domain-containing protein n=1 Tax=Diaporthe helianthi TaxID=158607 RepID=A0A2P5HGE3_DIAHE|nr:CAP-Gly domain-containing protein [Diaporthe helianthi]